MTEPLSANFPDKRLINPADDDFHCTICLARGTGREKTLLITLQIGAEIQAIDDPAWLIGKRHWRAERTGWKWRKRARHKDRCHMPHRLQNALTNATQSVAETLRKTLLISLDDLLASVRECLNLKASRSGQDRSHRRWGAGNLRSLQAMGASLKHSASKAFEADSRHIEVKCLPQKVDETLQRYLSVPNDRQISWVFISISETITAASARRFFINRRRSCPILIGSRLKDKRKELNVRQIDTSKRPATVKHGGDLLFAELSIVHALTPPPLSRTNSMVERIEGRIEKVFQNQQLRSAEEQKRQATPLCLALHTTTPEINSEQ
jgi:hypothetical protein